MELSQSVTFPAAEYVKRPTELTAETLEDACLSNTDIIERPGEWIYPDDALATLFSRQSHFDAVIITHNDLDGETAGTLVGDFKYTNPLIVPLWRGNNDLNWIQKFLKTTPTNTPFYILDHGPDPDDVEDWYQVLNDSPNTIELRDHHEHFPELHDAEGVNYIHDPDKCASEIVFEEDLSTSDSSLAELVDHVSAFDLWERDSPQFAKGNLLNTANYTLKYPTYRRLVKENGIDLVDNSEIADLIREHHYIDYAKADWVTDNWVEYIETNNHTVALTYGHVNPNLLGTQLVKNGRADILIHGKPNPKISIRTHEDLPTAHLIAAEYTGGGHEHAAGCGDPVAPTYTNTSFKDFHSNTHEERFQIYQDTAQSVVNNYTVTKES